jgi:hypothetical protein
MKTSLQVQNNGLPDADFQRLLAGVTITGKAEGKCRACRKVRTTERKFSA